MGDVLGTPGHPIWRVRREVLGLLAELPQTESRTLDQLLELGWGLRQSDLRKGVFPIDSPEVAKRAHYNSIRESVRKTLHFLATYELIEPQQRPADDNSNWSITDAGRRLIASLTD